MSDGRPYLAAEAVAAMKRLREAEWHRLRQVYRAAVPPVRLV